MGTRRSVADFNEIRPDHRPDKLSPAEVYEIRDSIAGEYSYFPGRVSLILVIKADRIMLCRESFTIVKKNYFTERIWNEGGRARMETKTKNFQLP